jgi:hypothetical protein
MTSRKVRNLLIKSRTTKIIRIIYRLTQNAGGTVKIPNIFINPKQEPKKNH